MPWKRREEAAQGKQPLSKDRDQKKFGTVCFHIASAPDWRGSNDENEVRKRSGFN
jgi:hypothetical protein